MGIALEEEGDSYGKWGEIDRRACFQHLHWGVAHIDTKCTVVGETTEEVDSYVSAVKVLGEIFTFVA